MKPHEVESGAAPATVGEKAKSSCHCASVWEGDLAGMSRSRARIPTCDAAARVAVGSSVRNGQCLEDTLRHRVPTPSRPRVFGSCTVGAGGAMEAFGDILRRFYRSCGVGRAVAHGHARIARACK